MHEWEKQEKLLEKIEAYKIDNCLVYNKFAYEKHEWDNIPGIVPRYVIYLSKYMMGLVDFCHEMNTREHIDHLRGDMTDKLQKTTEHINDNRETDEGEKKIINETIMDLDRLTKTFKKD